MESARGYTSNSSPQIHTMAYQRTHSSADDRYNRAEKPAARAKTCYPTKPRIVLPRFRTVNSLGNVRHPDRAPSAATCLACCPPTTELEDVDVLII